MADLFNAINGMDGPPPPVRMTAEIARRDLLGPSPRATLLVAELDGAAVGFVTGNTLYDSARAADCVFLNDLHVAPGARRRGADCLWRGVDLPDIEASRFFGVGDEGGFAGRVLAGPAFDALADTAEPG